MIYKIGIETNSVRLIKYNVSNFDITFIYLFILEITKKPGKVAVITGGARGIGLEVVKKLVQCEMHVVIGNIMNQYYLKKKLF